MDPVRCAEPSRCCVIIQACIVLHNIAITRRDYIPVRPDVARIVQNEVRTAVVVRGTETDAGKALRRHYVNTYFS